jgi:hypothetical protein
LGEGELREFHLAKLNLPESGLKEQLHLAKRFDSVSLTKKKKVQRGLEIHGVR